MDKIIAIIAGALGTLGFALIFRSKKEHLVWLTLGGGLSWAVYVLTEFLSLPEPVCYFIASVSVSLYCELFARFLKTPATNLLIPTILPLIPGGALYYTMRYALGGDRATFLENGERTLAIALAIALGIIIVSAAVRLVSDEFHAKKEKHRHKE